MLNQNFHGDLDFSITLGGRTGMMPDVSLSVKPAIQAVVSCFQVLFVFLFVIFIRRPGRRR
jgi:hypothetical protein